MIHGLPQVNKEYLNLRNLQILFLLLIGLRKHCRVFGDSMLPLIQEGDFLIYKPIKITNTQLKKGSLVILKHPISKHISIVKRIYSITPYGIEVRGDNELESIDSRQFGLINSSELEGIVELILPSYLSSN